MKTIKTINFDHIQQRIASPTSELPEHNYEHMVQQTAKLIKRSYIATAKLVETWSLEKIIQRYELCTKHAGTMPGDVKWWWLRKTDAVNK